jgi:hypothetical protein
LVATLEAKLAVQFVVVGRYISINCERAHCTELHKCVVPSHLLITEDVGAQKRREEMPAVSVFLVTPGDGVV